MMPHVQEVKNSSVVLSYFIFRPINAIKLYVSSSSESIIPFYFHNFHVSYSGRTADKKLSLLILGGSQTYSKALTPKLFNNKLLLRKQANAVKVISACELHEKQHTVMKIKLPDAMSCTIWCFIIYFKDKWPQSAFI